MQQQQNCKYPKWQMTFVVVPPIWCHKYKRSYDIIIITHTCNIWSILYQIQFFQNTCYFECYHKIIYFKIIIKIKIRLYDTWIMLHKWYETSLPYIMCCVEINITPIYFTYLVHSLTPSQTFYFRREEYVPPLPLWFGWRSVTSRAARTRVDTWHLSLYHRWPPAYSCH